jgi:hypothetical protein
MPAIKKLLIFMVMLSPLISSLAMGKPILSFSGTDLTLLEEAIKESQLELFIEAFENSSLTLAEKRQLISLADDQLARRRKNILLDLLITFIIKPNLYGCTGVALAFSAGGYVLACNSTSVTFQKVGVGMLVCGLVSTALFVSIIKGIEANDELVKNAQKICNLLRQSLRADDQSKQYWRDKIFH